MKIVLAPQLDLPPGPRPPVLWDELVRHGVVEVPDDSEDSVSKVVKQLIEARPDLVGAEPQVDAPPFSAELWWVSTVRRRGDAADVVMIPAMDAFGIDADGRVHFAYLRDMPLANLVRAVAQGHYDSDEDHLVVTRAGEFGGNGFLITSLVLWLLQEVPSVLLGVGADRAVLRRDAQKREELEDLAADWAGRHILYPMKLKQFIETKNSWFSSVLAQRLAMSEAAARRLLDAVGYEQSLHDDELMEYSDSPAAQGKRQRWEDAQWADTFTTLDELLDSQTGRPDNPPAMDEFPQAARETMWGRLRARATNWWAGRDS